MTDLLEIVEVLERLLDEARVSHAFGGAIALGFHIVEPRATRDVDLNIFVPPDDARRVFNLLPPEIAWNDADVERVERDGQVRLFWSDDVPVDFFFTNHPFHLVAEEHRETVSIEGLPPMPVLAANELAVFKAFFNRTRDWADIEAMVDAGTVDLHWVIGWMVDLLGPDDERVGRLRTLLDRPPPGPEPRFMQ
jgi:hypothetical protein